MIDICSNCKEHCEFIKEDEFGEEIDPSHPDYDETEVLSNCCGAKEYYLE